MRSKVLAKHFDSSLWTALVAGLLAGLWLVESSAGPRPSTSRLSSVKQKQSSDEFPALQWKVGLEGQREQDALSNQRLQTQFNLGLKSNYKLTDFVYILAEPRAIFLNGNVQSPSATSPKSSQFEIVEASANLHYKKTLELSAGALNQQATSSSILLGDLAFPGARAKGLYSFLPGNSVAIFAQYAVPTSATLSSNSKDFEKIPSFTSVGWLSEGRMGIVVTKTMGQYFEFSDLPSSVAGDSASLGNSTTSSSTSSLHNFLFSYRGYNLSLFSTLEISSQLSFGFKAQGVRNLGALSNLSEGYSAQLLGTLRLSDSSLSPYYEYFRIEPDATVAYYTSRLYQTNRIGSHGGLSLQFKNLFTVSASGGVRDALFESAIQTRENFYVLKLETLYAPF
jgi:hypothetical protein